MDSLFDTSILVDHLRGDDRATQLLLDSAARGRPLCSVMTIVELAIGTRGHQVAGITSLRRVLTQLPVDERVAQMASEYAHTWGASHRAIDPVDYVIAATAAIHGAQLQTRNTKHFPMLKGLVAPYGA